MPKTSTCTEWSITSSAGTQRVDRGRVAAHRGHRVAHGGEVDDGRHAGEVLHEHARGREGDLARGLGSVATQLASASTSCGPHRDAVLVAQQVLEQDLQRVRQPRDVEARLQRVEPVDLVLAPADREGGAGAEGVLGGHRLPP